MAKTFHNTVLGAMRTVQRNRGQTITYARGDVTAQLQATCSPKNYQAMDDAGITVTYHCHDWLIVAADLVLPIGTDGAAEAIEPAARDRITDEAGTVHEIFLIPGRNVYDSGVDDIHYRIHSIIVDRA